MGAKLAYEGPWHDGKVRVEADTVSELNELVLELNQNGTRKSTTLRLDDPATELNSEYPSISGTLSCTDAIRALLNSRWGKSEGRTEAELTGAMKASAIHYPHGTISGLLTSLTRRGELRRVGKKDGSYAYVISQAERDA